MRGTARHTAVSAYRDLSNDWRKWNLAERIISLVLPLSVCILVLVQMASH